MAKAIDLTGQTFGLLTAIERIPDKYTKYKVKCTCGREKIVRGTNLTNGLTKSCTCQQAKWRGDKNKKAAGIAGRNKVLKGYKANAKNRGLAFSITDEVAFEIFEHPCYYCGVLRYNKMLPNDSHAAYEYNGIDRIDNTRGYVKGNIVACCGRCNRAKDVMSVNEFDQWIEHLYITLQQRRGGNWQG